MVTLHDSCTCRQGDGSCHKKKLKNLWNLVTSMLDWYCDHTALWFSKRCIKFIKMALNSDNIIVRTIMNIGLNST